MNPSPQTADVGPDGGEVGRMAGRDHRSGSNVCVPSQEARTLARKAGLREADSPTRMPPDRAPRR